MWGPVLGYVDGFRRMLDSLKPLLEVVLARAGRKLIEAAIELVAVLYVEVRSLKRAGEETGAGAAVTSGFVFRRAKEAASKVAFAVLLLDPEDVDLEPAVVAIDAADEASNRFATLVSGEEVERLGIAWIVQSAGEGGVDRRVMSVEAVGDVLGGMVVDFAHEADGFLSRGAENGHERTGTALLVTSESRERSFGIGGVGVIDPKRLSVVRGQGGGILLYAGLLARSFTAGGGWPLYSFVPFSRPFLACVFVGSACLGSAQEPSRTVSGAGTLVYLGAGLALPLLRDGVMGKERFWRTADALGTSLLLNEGLKSVVRARRPDGSDLGSFPSGHATLAFTVATMASSFHPREAPLWYAGAAWIAYSRVQLRKHNVLDVLAGAGLGYGVARLELSLPHGLILQPLIGRGGGAGLMLSGRF